MYDLHGRMIQKALDGYADVQLKECIALGDNRSRHIITSTTSTVIRKNDINKPKS